MTDIMSKNSFAAVQSAHDSELEHLRDMNRRARQKKLDQIAEANMVRGLFAASVPHICEHSHCRVA